MAKRVNYIVVAPTGRLNVRERPSLDARILYQLPYGAKVKIDGKTEAAEGWKAIEGGGFVMKCYLK